ncbi:MAG: hypothetical protein FJX71_01215 [Alphaproteobacteria bacterium]|nr:hypothetical protein [Alphaproteobacteria bacterium]
MKYFFVLLGALYCACPPSLAEPADPKAYLQMLFENKGGYTIPEEEITAILTAGGHPQYGEITYDSASHILNDLDLTKNDVFYDLGSGVGKLVLQVYLTTPVKKSVGIELSKTRWNIAETCRRQIASDEHTTAGRDLSFLNQNISATNISDATVCFISGITFPQPLIHSIMDRLSAIDHEVKVISVLPLPFHKHFKLLKTYTLPMSWSPEGVEVCLYQLTPTSQFEPAENLSKLDRKRKRRVLHEED